MFWRMWRDDYLLYTTAVCDISLEQKLNDRYVVYRMCRVVNQNSDNSRLRKPTP